MISKEEEEANRPAPRERKQGGRAKQMFTPDQMGPADWKEQLEGFQKEQDTTFVNMPVIVDNRKVAA